MMRKHIETTLNKALAEKDACTASTIRLVLAALRDRSTISDNGSVNGADEDRAIRNLLQTMVQQRTESAETCLHCGDHDGAALKEREIAVIHRFLPSPLDEETMRKAVRRAITETHATGLKEIGKVMNTLRNQHAGTMDFTRAKAIARDELSSLR